VSTEFRHRTRVEVRFRDLDAFGHVNNAVTTSYVEHGRISYLRDVLEIDPVSRFPLIMATLRVDYLTPIFFGQVIEVGTRVDWIGRTSLAMSHQLTAAGDGHDVARATTLLVAYDYEAARPRPIREDWRGAFARYEGRDLQRPQGDA
jgi:acyl-CoA thioester hydrolase